MKLSLSILLLVIGAIQVAAAPFQNLNFDAANTNTLTVQPGPIFRGTGPAEDLLPGWALARGATPQPTLGLNLSLLSPGYATIISADQSELFDIPVEGAYALYLVGAPGDLESFSLSQRGELPGDAQLLTLRYSGFPFNLTVDGVDLQPASQTSTSQVFDISEFSGQIIDLTLTALGPLMPMEPGTSSIDSIAFIVPEPSIVTLTVLGIAGLLLSSRARRRA